MFFEFKAEKGEYLVETMVKEYIKINKGYSNDEKFHVKINQKDYLLRVSPKYHLKKVQQLFTYIKKVNQLKVPTYKPIEIMIQDDKIHSLYEWIKGNDLIDVISNYADKECYEFGLNAGKYLKMIHTIKAPLDIESWDIRFNRKIDRNILRYLDSPLDIPKTQYFIDYLEANRDLLKNRPQTFQHGDYHIGNMMIDDNEKLIVIDYDRYDFGDPFEEFNRIVWSAECSPLFASGIINGYFDHQVPETFWQLMLLYISSNVMSSLTWALTINEDELETMIEQMHHVLEWYDYFNRTIPKWYIKRFK